MPFQRSAKHKKYYSFNANGICHRLGRYTSELSLDDCWKFLFHLNRRLLRGKMWITMIWTGEKWKKKQFLCWMRRENKNISNDGKRSFRIVCFPTFAWARFPLRFFLQFFLVYLQRRGEGFFGFIYGSLCENLKRLLRNIKLHTSNSFALYHFTSPPFCHFASQPAQNF